MAFSSQIYPGEVIFNDDPADNDIIFPPGHARGLNLSPRAGREYAYGNTADPFPAELLIPRSEWQARIQEMEERKSRLSDLVIQAELPCHDQDSISYCWIHAPTHCVEIIRVLQNQPMVLLSATSTGAIIKNFSNQGGWGEEGLRKIIEIGVVPQSLWPENQLNRKYDTAENWAAAKDYRVDEWWELRPRNLDEQVSLLLRRWPLAVGLNYWGHEVTDYDAVWLDGEAAIRFRNSWAMSWGDKGFGIRQGSKRLADDAVSPRTAKAA